MVKKVAKRSINSNVDIILSTNSSSHTKINQQVINWNSSAKITPNSGLHEYRIEFKKKKTPKWSITGTFLIIYII